MGTMKQQYMRDIFDFVNTAAGKTVAIGVAFMLMFTLSSIAFAVDEAIQVVGAEETPTAASGANDAGATGEAASSGEADAPNNSGEAIEAAELAETGGAADPKADPNEADENTPSEASDAESAATEDAADTETDAEQDIDEAIRDAVTQDAPATEDPTIQVDEASISISTENCAIEIGGAAIVGGSAKVPLHTPLTFNVVPDTGYVVESVSITASGWPVPAVLGADDLPCEIPAEDVDSNLTITATAVLYDQENPPDDTTPDPIDDETELVPDGFYDAPTLSIGNMTSIYMGVQLQLYNEDFDAVVEGLQEGDELIISGYEFATEDPDKIAGKDAGTYSVAVTDYWIKRSEQNRDVTREYQPIDLSSAHATLTIEKAPLYVVTPSATKVFDGEPLTYAGEGGEYDILDVEGLMADGMLAQYDGPAVLYTLYDYFEGEYMWVAGSQTNVGTSPNRVEIRADVLEELLKNYNIAYRLGTLRVTTEDVVIYAPTASKVYDGTPLEVSAEDLYWDNLPAGFTVEARIVNGSRTEVGTQVVSIDPASVRIFDAEGNDVTSTYEDIITLAEGELVIDRLVTPGGTGGNTSGNGNGGSTRPAGGASNPPAGVFVAGAGTAYVSPAAALSTPAPAAANTEDTNGNATTEDAEEEDGINETVAAVAQGMQNAMQFLNGDEMTELAAPATEESLTDDETPLGVFDKPVDCWVHWYTILGILATAIYGAVVMFFRRAYAYELESREASILGVPVGMAQPRIPAGTNGHAGREA